MPDAWNRKTRRKMSRYGLGQETMRQELDKATEAARINASTYAFGACFLALHRLHGFDEREIHEVAVAAVNIINNSLCASDVARELKRLTGFDVDQPILDEELEDWVPIGLDGLEDLE